MAIRVNDSQFGSLTVPSAVSRINVRTGAGGLGSFGAVAILGESTAGDATTSEEMVDNWFTPDQFATVANLYGAGPIVDVFRSLTAPSADPAIPSAPSRIYIYKTNQSTSGTLSVPAITSAYGDLSARLAGVAGNQLTWDVDVGTSAVQPTSGTFTFIPVGSAASGTFRLNGGSASTVTLGLNQAPNVAVSNLNNVTGLLATGGQNRSAFAGLSGVTLTVAVTGQIGEFTLQSGSQFAVVPSVGDTLVVPDGTNYGTTVASVFAGGSAQNQGGWVVTAVTSTANLARITATKLSSTAVTSSVVAPINVSTTLSVGLNNDIQVYSPIQVFYKAGQNRSSLANAGGTQVSLTATGASLRLNLLGGTTGFAQGASLPVVGDDLVIPAGSGLAGAGSANVGYYQVSSVYNVTGSTYVVATRLSNGTPVNVSSTALNASPNTDAIIQRPWVDGRVSEFELSDGGAALGVGTTLFTLGTTTSLPIVSAIGATVVVPGTEYQATLKVNRTSDGIAEIYEDVGGNTAFEVGYLGTSATCTVSAVSMAFTVSGGNGANLTITFSDYPTVGDVVDFINQQTSYFADATAAARQIALTYLDENDVASGLLDQGSFACATSIDESLPLKIKRDLFDFKSTISGSPTVGFASTATAGLPEPSDAKLLSGGSRGATSGANITDAFTALEAVDSLNFVIPLFSRDATADIADSLTATGSTYTIAGINAALKSHCLAMSQIKRKKNRLGIASFKGTFAETKAMVATLANARVAMTFQDVKALSLDGTIKTFQPYMGAAVAAGMQSVGLYRSITRKFANITGIVNPSGFNPNSFGDLEDALLSGLLCLQAPPTGGFRWVSDQTTYSKDDNGVFNSLCNMYMADFIAIDLANALDNTVIGQSVADFGASQIKSLVEAKLAQYLQNKLISPSDGAPAGYTGLAVTVSGAVARVSVNCFISNAILFVLTDLDISLPTQSA